MRGVSALQRLNVENRSALTLTLSRLRERELAPSRCANATVSR